LQLSESNSDGGLGPVDGHAARPFMADQRIIATTATPPKFRN